MPLAIGREGRHVLVPAFGQLAVLHPVELLGQFRILGRDTARTRSIQASRSSFAALADALAESARRRRRARETSRPRASRSCAWRA